MASPLWAWTSVARMVVGRISITEIFSGGPAWCRESEASAFPRPDSRFWANRPPRRSRPRTSPSRPTQTRGPCRAPRSGRCCASRPSPPAPSTWPRPWTRSETTPSGWARLTPPAAPDATAPEVGRRPSWQSRGGVCTALEGRRANTGQLEHGVRLAVGAGAAAVAEALLGLWKASPRCLPQLVRWFHKRTWTGRRWSIGEVAQLAADCAPAGPTKLDRTRVTLGHGEDTEAKKHHPGQPPVCADMHLRGLRPPAPRSPAAGRTAT
jgi:hypothetical protein